MAKSVKIDSIGLEIKIKKRHCTTLDTKSIILFFEHFMDTCRFWSF